MKRKKPKLKDRWVQIIRYEDEKDWEDSQHGFYSENEVKFDLGRIWRKIKYFFNKDEKSN